MLCYEKTGYDNSQPGRRAELVPDLSVQRLADFGADAAKVLLFYSPFEDAFINDEKHAFVERVGAECLANNIPFFLEFIGYDPKGGDEKGLKFAKKKPEIVNPRHAGVLERGISRRRSEGRDPHQSGVRQRVPGLFRRKQLIRRRKRLKPIARQPRLR